MGVPEKVENLRISGKPAGKDKTKFVESEKRSAKCSEGFTINSSQGDIWQTVQFFVEGSTGRFIIYQGNVVNGED